MVARLSIKSWLDHGVGFRLYAYGPVEGVPQGTEMADASTVISRKHVYVTPMGSLAPFSDWFRYALLASEGGIWSDLDLVCLKPELPPRGQWPWFARETERTAAIGMLAFEPHHPLMDDMRKLARDPAAIMPWETAAQQKAKSAMRRGTPCPAARRRLAPWSTAGPQGFTRGVRHYGLWERAAGPETIYPVYYRAWRYLFNGNLRPESPELKQAWAVHLWNEMIRRHPEVEAGMHPQSVVASLMRRHGIAREG